MIHRRTDTQRKATYSRVITRLSVLLLLVTAVSCGKIAAPIPRVRYFERTTSLEAVQRGSAIILSWPSPKLGEYEPGKPFLARVDIYRFVELKLQEPLLDPYDFEEQAQIIGSIDRARIEAQVLVYGGLQWIDPLKLDESEGVRGIRIRYAIRYVNERDQAAAFSNSVAIEPWPRVSKPPLHLRLTKEEQDSLTIQWDPPESNIDGQSPAATVGYFIYRRLARRALAREALNPEPLTESTFTDKNFKYEASYVYTVRALSQATEGLIESADSEPLAITPEDTFPPSPPEPVSIAAANQVAGLFLFWPRSPDTDVEGYCVYRAETADAPDEKWKLLNKKLLTTFTYRDDDVEAVKRYYYRVTAVDRFDNESKPSTTVSEIAGGQP